MDEGIIVRLINETSESVHRQFTVFPFVLLPLKLVLFTVMFDLLWMASFCMGDYFSALKQLAEAFTNMLSC